MNTIRINLIIFIKNYSIKINICLLKNLYDMYSTKGNNNHNNIFFCLSKINLKK